MILSFSDDDDERMSGISMSSPSPSASGMSGSSLAAAGAMMQPPSPVSREQLQKRIESLQQQNKVLKCELETYKLRVKSLQEENKAIRQASVHMVSQGPLILNKLLDHTLTTVSCGLLKFNA
jgi:hypothetical protein